MRAPAFDTPTVLLAMPDTPQRTSLTDSLVQRGDRVLLCSSPWTGEGSCPLLRDAPCALIEIADVAVVAEDRPGHGAEGAPGLCALYARRSIPADGVPTDDLIRSIDRMLSANPDR